MGQIDEVKVDGVPMRIAYSEPNGAGPHPGMLVMFHRGGFDGFTQKISDDLAELGFLAAAMDLYHWPPVHEKAEDNDFPRDPEIVKDVGATIDWMAKRGDVDMSHLAIIGHCMGGRMAMLGASTHDRIGACVDYYGGNLFKPWSDDGPPPFDLLKNMKAKVIGFSGDQDQNPSPEDMDKISAELTKCGVDHQFHLYPGAGHAFQNFLSDERYRDEATRDSWSRTVAFLENWKKS
jgi:carboxymethylenebutenolidase